jgi:hypothetical protein
MGMSGLMTPDRTIGWPGPLLLSRGRALEPFLPPEPVHPFVVHQPALSPEHAVRHPPAPADVLGCDLPETTPQLGFLNVDNFAGMSLRAAVLAHHPAGESL